MLSTPRLPQPQSPTPTAAQKRTRKPRSASAPQLELPLTPDQRYTEIEIPEITADHTHAKVIKHLKKPLANEKELAHVYIVQDPERPKYIKIGSAHFPADRFRQIEKKCRFKKLTSVFRSKFLPQALAMKVEELVHQELGYFRRRFLCGACKERHREYFEIESEIAERVIERWISLLEEGGYGDDGILMESWRLKLNRFPVQNRPVQSHEDHDGRHSWWERLKEELMAPESELAMDEDESDSVLVTRRNSPAALDAGLPNHASLGQEWPLWCIFQAFILFFSSSHWFLKYCIYTPNLIGTIAVWIVVHLDAFAKVRSDLSRFI